MPRAAVVLVVFSLVAPTVAQPPQVPKKYFPGPDSQVKEGVPQGRLVGPTLFESKVFANTARQYWVYVPAQYTPDKPAAVLVFQDGARATNPKGVIRVQTVLDNLIHEKAIPVTIGIFITPGQRFTEKQTKPEEKFPPTIGTGNPNNRSVEYDSLGDAYARFLLDDMLPEVAKSYNLTKDPDERCIGGSSSGGICAFNVAWERPNDFRKVISFIGHFTNIRGGHVFPDLVLKEDKKPIRVFLQDGVNDLRSPNNLNRDWYLQNQKMRAALREKGYDYWYVLGEDPHRDDHGGAMLPDALRWIWRDHSAVKK
jgi:enterochelin esterase family protein